MIALGVEPGPAFLVPECWIQPGVIGVVLFGSGMAALFRRKEILEIRQKLTREWKKWDQ